MKLRDSHVSGLAVIGLLVMVFGPMILMLIALKGEQSEIVVIGEHNLPSSWDVPWRLVLMIAFGTLAAGLVITLIWRRKRSKHQTR